MVHLDEDSEFAELLGAAVGSECECADFQSVAEVHVEELAAGDFGLQDQN